MEYSTFAVSLENYIKYRFTKTVDVSEYIVTITRRLKRAGFIIQDHDVMLVFAYKLIELVDLFHDNCLGLIFYVVYSYYGEEICYPYTLFIGKCNFSTILLLSVKSSKIMYKLCTDKEYFEESKKDLLKYRNLYFI